MRRKSFLLLALAPAVLVCVPSPTPPSGEQLCDWSGACADGYYCSGGACWKNGDTPHGASGGAGGGSGKAGESGIAALADNVIGVSVDSGLPNIGYVNGLFANITVCVPGTSDCQTIDHVLVDTGSSGLRLLGSALTLSLPAWTDGSGGALAECAQMVSGFIWGPLRTLDLSIAGEQAKRLAIQVIEEASYPVPRDCTGSDAGTAEALGANGFLGVGTALQDCGSACAAPLGAGSANPGAYYACSSTANGGCQAAAVPVSKQVSNPVSFFSQDNNGIIIELPPVPADGASSVTGALVFGIGTRDNNNLGQATVLPLDSLGHFLTKYPANGTTWQAFADTGSNAIYFLDSATTGIPTCSDAAAFYCPNSTLSLSAKIQDSAGLVAVSVNFSIANAERLGANNNYIAFDNLGGPSVAGMWFEWGLPFHFGRNVFIAIEGQSTPTGAGPFIAF
ncbi:MAG: DUF3443 domain-containing protein [Polyangia bacterium]